MWEIIQDAGWPIWPLIFTSVAGFSIIIERLFSLRSSNIIPEDLMPNLELQLKKRGNKKRRT